MRIRNLLSAGAALALLVGLAFVAVTLSPRPSKPPVPVQQTGTAAGLPHRVSAAATLGHVVDGRVIPDTSSAVSFGISGTGAVAGVASGSTVSYPGVRPDAAVSFTAGTGLVKESIVLSSPSAPDTWVFPLDLKGLRAEMGPGGVVEFADSAGGVLAYVPRGFMTDSDISPRSGDGATSYGVTYSLVTVAGRQAIRMTLDAAWLDSKARVYPVTVDPSVQDEGADSADPTDPSGSADDPVTGKIPASREITGEWDARAAWKLQASADSHSASRGLDS
jgi:hypothetical protein